MLMLHVAVVRSEELVKQVQLYETAAKPIVLHRRHVRQ